MTPSGQPSATTLIDHRDVHKRCVHSIQSDTSGLALGVDASVTGIVNPDWRYNHSHFETPVIIDCRRSRRLRRFLFHNEPVPCFASHNIQIQMCRRRTVHMAPEVTFGRELPSIPLRPIIRHHRLLVSHRMISPFLGIMRNIRHRVACQPQRAMADSGTLYGRVPEPCRRINHRRHTQMFLNQTHTLRD